MLRLTLGPPQQLVDNYNAQLGVPPEVPSMLSSGPVLSRSESITSNGDCSMSSGCVSEVDEENGFNDDFPDGGTIKRKPQISIILLCYSRNICLCNFYSGWRVHTYSLVIVY